jgi:hypothetical protein
MNPIHHISVVSVALLIVTGSAMENAWAQSAQTLLNTLQNDASSAAAQCPQQTAPTATSPPMSGCNYMSERELVVSIPFDKTCDGKMPITPIQWVKACVAYVNCAGAGNQGSSVCPLVNGHCPDSATTCANDTTLDENNSDMDFMKTLCLSSTGQPLAGCTLPVSLGGGSTNGSGSGSAQ